MTPFTRTPTGVYVAWNATITGEVTLGADCSVWFGAVIRGDVAPVIIGERTNIQDNAVVHCDNGFPNTIGNDVVIGHGAIVHGSSIGDGALIGMHATLLGKTRVGRRCLIGAGTVLAPGTDVPDGMLVMGVPGKIIRPVREEDLAYMQGLAKHYVELAEKYVQGKMNFTPGLR